MLLAAAAYAVPALAGLAAFLNPLRQKTLSRQSIRVCSLPALTVGGPPQRFPVIADRTDAWNRYPAEPIGAVFLRRTGPATVVAWQSLCPHAGCCVTLEPAAAGFVCPCHRARFDLEGRRTDPASMSPRDLDSLAVEIRNAAEVWVRFEKFRSGTPAKIATS